mmetsp:Transcript_29225/g.89935  ORF Transcript_29225/g.89935 Transcript_29225/m.89935 type:complete len:724 (+) Transcript_29225:101-2272(+)
MGYRMGGPFGSMGLGNAPATPTKGPRLVDDARFTSSYGAAFARASGGGEGAPRGPLRSAAVSSLAAGPAASPKPGLGGGGLEVSSLRGVSRSLSEASLARPPVKTLEARRPTVQLGARAEAKPPAAKRAPAGGQARAADAGARRKTLEMLADPNLQRMAQEIFKSHDTSKKGRLEFQDLCSVLRDLHTELDLAMPDINCAEQLFKKFDVNNDRSLASREFFELLKSMLRRSAFDRSSTVNREFFITKQTTDVWKVYDRTRELGAGSFGKAYLAKSKRGGEERVVKAVLKTRSTMPLDDIEQEILIMRQVDHPHVVRLFEWYEDSNHYYLVLEALKGGTLKDVVLNMQKQRKGVKEEWIRKVMGQVVEAMAFCHSLRLIHKDLKDENIMLLRKDPDFNEPYAVVIDLGIAEMFSVADPNGREMGGTPTTMAPEVWTGSFGPKCDVFSLGCVLFEMLSGNYPFMANSMKPAAWLRVHKKGPDWNLVRTSREGKELCKRMLAYVESARPSMVECREDPYFSVDRSQLSTVPPAQFQPFAAFCEQQAAKRSLLLEIAARLPMERAGEVIKLFESIDSDYSGHLSKQELERYLRHMEITDEALIQDTFQALDADRDGKLSFSEFAAGALLLFKDKLEERLYELFKDHDRNGSGELDIAEAKDFLDDVSAAVDRDSGGVQPSMLRQLMDEAQGGVLTYEQLRQHILVPGSHPASARRSPASSVRNGRSR